MLLKEKRFRSLCLSLLLLGLNLAAFNLLLDGCSGSRLDLTQERLFSVSPATQRILQSLDDTVVIHGYFSGRSHPLLAPLVTEIRDMLDEYAAVSGGRVVVEVSDPNENEDALEEANSRFGVESTPFRVASKYESGIVNAFFALVVEYGDRYERYGVEDLIEVSMRADGEVDVGLRGLEYDLTRAIKKVVYGFRGAAELFERVPGEVRMLAVVTPRALPETFAGVPAALREAAAQLEERGGVKFGFEEIDPSGDEALQAELLQQFGMRPMQLNVISEGTFFLYCLLQIGERLERIQVTEPDLTASQVREAVENALRRATPGFLKTVGIHMPPPEWPPELIMQAQMQRQTLPDPPPEFAEVARYLADEYSIVDVDLADPAGVPSSVDVLLVLKPTELAEREAFHIDQYLMRGGRVILCAGNYKVDFGPNGLRALAIHSGLAEWLAHHGITVARELVLDKQNQPLPVPEVKRTSLGAVRTIRLVPYPYMVEVAGEGFVQKAIAARLEGMGIYWGSPVRVDAERTGELEVIELIRSSEESWTSTDLEAVGLLEYRVPFQGLAPQLLGVALSGRFRSFWAGKDPPPAEPEPLMPEDEPAGPQEPAAEVVIEESPDTRLVVIGNAEFLSDFVANALSLLDSGFFQENLRFTQNLIDWVNLDNEMLSIRSRGVGTRRIQRLEKPQQQAIEWANYGIPIGLIIAVGAWRAFRRGKVRPVLGAAGRREKQEK